MIPALIPAIDFDVSTTSLFGIALRAYLLYYYFVPDNRDYS